MPAPGDLAPDFTLPAEPSGSVTLSALRGKSVVLYFYPKDDTPGCTVQACELRDASPRLDEQGAVVLGVSKDSLKSHTKFREKYSLPFPLLSDPDLTVHRAYGAYGMKKMYGKDVEGVIRSVVVIGPDGRIKSIGNGVKAAGTAERALKAIAGR